MCTSIAFIFFLCFCAATTRTLSKPPESEILLFINHFPCLLHQQNISSTSPATFLWQSMLIPLFFQFLLCKHLCHQSPGLYFRIRAPKHSELISPTATGCHRRSALPGILGLWHPMALLGPDPRPFLATGLPQSPAEADWCHFRRALKSSGTTVLYVSVQRTIQREQSGS